MHHLRIDDDIVAVLNDLVIVVINHRHHGRTSTGVRSPEIPKQQTALTDCLQLWAIEGAHARKRQPLLHLGGLTLCLGQIRNPAIGWINDHRGAVFTIDLHNFITAIQPECVVGSRRIAVTGRRPIRVTVLITPLLRRAGTRLKA